MADALIGYTGFVGGNLLRQARFEGRYNSRNIDDIRGRHYDIIVCAGAPAEKWKANQAPEDDRRNLARLADALAEADARRLVLISTVDVYPGPVGVDEDTPIDPSRATAYGRHRYRLEQYLAERFDTLIVRLPGLFGPGLKKNVIYDLLHDNEVHKINTESIYQFYDVTRLWRDVRVAEGAGLGLLNVATEPLGTAEIATAVFGRALPRPEAGAVAARYDFRSRHAELFGGSDGYLCDRAEVLAALAQFVAGERQRAAA